MPYPLGLSFGPTYITGSHALDDGSIVPVTRVSATVAYQSFFQQTLKKRVQDDLQSRPRETVPDTHLFPSESQAGELEALFIHELTAIKADSERIRGTAVDVKAISIPYHWNTTAQSAIFSAAHAANIPLAGTHMLLSLPRSLEKAYNFESNIAEDDYYFIVVDYNQSYLHLLTCETAKNGGYALVEGQVQLPHLGEYAISRGESNYEQILEALEKFISLTTVKDPSSASGRLPYHNIKAVIISGEATSKAMQRMHEVVQRIFSDLGEDVLYDSLDPSYLGAMGAARAAMSQVVNPKSTRDFISMPGYIPDEPQLS